MMEMLGVPALIFALGMYLPLELNTPALVGGFLAHFLGKRAEATGGERGAGIRERGIVIASGLMAGGALGGVFGAALRLIPGYTEDWLKSPFYDNVGVSQTVSALLFVGLCLYVWYGSVRRTPGGLTHDPRGARVDLAIDGGGQPKASEGQNPA